jgi:hypothetical protein
VGPKFQANVSNAPTAENTATFGKFEDLYSFSWTYGFFLGADERGGSSSVEAMSLVNQMSEAEGEHNLLPSVM